MKYVLSLWLFVAGAAIASEGFRASFAIVSWQDSLTLTSPANEPTGLASSTLGVGLSAGRSLPLSQNSHLDFEAGLLLGQSDAGLPGALPNQLLYTARNISAFGGYGTIGWLLSFGEGQFTIGPAALILFKNTGWPQPSGGYVLTEETPFGAGAVIDARVRRGKWFVQSKFGFLRTLTKFYWSVGLGYSG